VAIISLSCVTASTGSGGGSKVPSGEQSVSLKPIMVPEMVGVADVLLGGELVDVIVVIKSIKFFMQSKRQLPGVQFRIRPRAKAKSLITA
jgi:hypothetical protein